MEELTENAFASITAPDNQTVNNYSGYTGYTVTYTVAYINSDLSNAGTGVTTNYKKITIQVTEPTGAKVSLNTIVTKRYYDTPQG